MIKWIKKSDKFRNVDLLIDELFPFFKTSKQLKRFTTDNRQFYLNFDRIRFRQEYTYIWNNKYSMDEILRGWIPTDLIKILRKYLKRDSKKFVKSLLIKWLGKVNLLFFELIWKNRNEKMIKWETDNNISFIQKKGLTSNNSNRSRFEERKKLKNRISGNKKAKFHVIDEELYQKIRLSFGFNPNSSSLGCSGGYICSNINM